MNNEQLEFDINTTLYLTLNANMLRIFISHELIFPLNKHLSIPQRYSFSEDNVIICTNKRCYINNDESLKSENPILIELDSSKFSDGFTSDDSSDLSVIKKHIAFSMIESIWFKTNKDMENFTLESENINYSRIKDKFKVLSKETKVLSKEIKSETIHNLEATVPDNEWKKMMRTYKLYAGLFGYLVSFEKEDNNFMYNYDETVIALLKSILGDSFSTNHSNTLDFSKVQQYSNWFDKLKYFLIKEDFSLFNDWKNNSTETIKIKDVIFFSVLIKVLIDDHEYDYDARTTFDKRRLFDCFISELKNTKKKSSIHPLEVNKTSLETIIFGTNISYKEHVKTPLNSYFEKLIPFIFKLIDQPNLYKYSYFADRFNLNNHEKSFLYALTGLFNGIAIYPDDLKKEYSYILNVLDNAIVVNNDDSNNINDNQKDLVGLTDFGYPLFKKNIDWNNWFKTLMKTYNEKQFIDVMQKTLNTFYSEHLKEDFKKKHSFFQENTLYISKSKTFPLTTTAYKNLYKKLTKNNLDELLDKAEFEYFKANFEKNLKDVGEGKKS